MPEPRIQIVVEHADHQFRYYQIPPGGGWRVDPAYRCLVIGRGLPRIYIPLDTVRAFTIEEVSGDA